MNKRCNRRWLRHRFKLKRSLLKHHRAWLERNHDRSADWLRARLAEGFEVHHIKPELGDLPTNLVLLTKCDHQMVHGAGIYLETAKRQVSENKRMQGEAAYTLRTWGHTWTEIRDIMGASHALNQEAKEYAIREGKLWPIMGKRRQGAMSLEQFEMMHPEIKS